MFGSGASRDFGPAKTSWRTEDPQVAKQKCLISSGSPTLTRVPLSASAAERRLLSADAPEPRLPQQEKHSKRARIAGAALRLMAFNTSDDVLSLRLTGRGRPAKKNNAIAIGS